MKGYPTSFAGLFEHHPDDAPTVQRIEIPLIQRDYAQGRTDRSVEQIRHNFLNVLHDAVTGGEPVGLDFVYGDVDTGTLRPLDGQQRLTTLFLLHWYLASRAGRLDAQHGWKQFSYATRPSARLFCERLVTFALPADALPPSAWITDQEWYLHVWINDPTIQSMLVVVDAFHEQFADADVEAAWKRLTNAESPAISFYLLPIDDMGSGEDLYIKMNSRGKPLTPFENFKARFETTLEEADRECAKRFAHKVDGDWSDLLWPMHGGDNLVDDEFMRYIGFITEVCEWREDRIESGPLDPRARQVFGTDNQDAAAHLDFLFNAFDVWDDARHIATTFESLFATSGPSAPMPEDADRVVLFGDNVNVNLFEACCHRFGEMSGRNRVFSLADSLLLYAVLLHLAEKTDDFPRRLRILRNLVASSEDEVRRPNMPRLINDLRGIVLEGDLDGVSTFNQVQVEDERLKREFLQRHPELERSVFGLEDHPILRGSLTSFELDSSTFNARAEAFDSVFAEGNWPLVTKALLSVGEYQRRSPRSGAFHFGSGSKNHGGVWRDLLTGTGRAALASTRAVLAKLLDQVASSDESAQTSLVNLSDAWLNATAEHKTLDWRYYFVKYDCMREGESGIYYGAEGESGIYYGAEGELGYSVIMLYKSQLNSWYRDPYLLAISFESGVSDAVDDPRFMGYDTTVRWLRLQRSATRMRCDDGSIVLQAPSSDEHIAQFMATLQHRDDVIEVGDRFRVPIRQVQRDGKATDAEDRVAKGAGLLKDLVDAGL